MKHLSKFQPAETILLLQDKNADLKELLKITFMDLLLKQALEIRTIAKRWSSRDEVRHYKYVLRGKNFLKFNPNEHEKVYLIPFQKTSSLDILFQHVVRMGFQNARSRKNYISLVRRSTTINLYFSSSFIQKIFGSFSITPEGLELRNEIKKEIALLEVELPVIINSDRVKALQILSAIGGNIFLLRNIDFSLLKQIDSEILAEMHRSYNSPESESGGFEGFFGCSSWDSGSSGCSGSGCSGCGSGCGGD